MLSNGKDMEPATEDTLAGHPLLCAVSSAQQRFIDTLFARITSPGNDWPVFDYVDRVLRVHGVDAATELARFPIGANRGNPVMGYRHIWTEGGGVAINEGSRVRLTIAGLRQESTGGGRQFADFLARVVGKLAALEESIEPDPDAVATATFDLVDDVLSHVGGSRTYQAFAPLIGSVLEREPPIFGCARTSGSAGETRWLVHLRNDLSAFVGVTDSEDYVRRVLVSIGADQPPIVAATVDTPLSLIDEIGYLDAVWQARTKEGPLFGATRVASCAGLALACATSEEFDARMNALYDVLNCMDVTLAPEGEEMLKGRPGSLQRLRARLHRGLPEDEHARVDSSIRLLQDAVRIRAALHSGAQADLASRYQSIGLAYPPATYGAAWDHIRGRASWAIRSIRQSVETLA
jgi:hypothetical protein